MSPSDTSSPATGDSPGGPSPWSWARGQLLVTIVQSLVLGMIGSALGLAFGRVVPIIGAWAVATICMLAFRLHRLLLPPRARRRRSLSTSVERSGTIGADPTQDDLAELPSGI